MNRLVTTAVVVIASLATAHADPPAPYSLGWSLRPVAPGNVIRSDTSVAMFRDAGMSGSTVASTFLVSYKLAPTVSPLVRVALSRNDPAAGDSATSISNTLLGAIWAPRVLSPPFKLGVFGGLALPIGSRADAATARAAMAARSSMDNALFAANDLTPIAGIDAAYVARNVTLQLEATLFELIRVRGADKQPDAYKTNLTTGLHAGYFVAPWLSVSGELRYQRYLSTPAFVAMDTSGHSRDTWSAAIGVRGHVALDRGHMLRPGLSYARGLDEPLTGRSYHIVQIDLPFAF